MPRLTGRGAQHSLTCEECSQTFLTKGTKTRFCSRLCAQRWTAKRRALPPVTLDCRQCGKPFTVIGSQVKRYEARDYSTRSFCSQDCAYAWKRIAPPTFICAHCGQETTRKKTASGSYYYVARFCSRACANAAQVKPDGWLHRRTGYRMVHDGGVSREEHRVVMEKVLRRRLLSYETVHHRNGQRADNRPENLEVWIGKHAPGGRLDEVLAWCAQMLTDHGYEVASPPPHVPPK